MSLLNNSNKAKDKKKPANQQAKPGLQAAPKGNTSSKGAAGAKNTRVTGRAQRGS